MQNSKPYRSLVMADLRTCVSLFYKKNVFGVCTVHMHIALDILAVVATVRLLYVAQMMFLHPCYVLQVMTLPQTEKSYYSGQSHYQL